jgi:hypothetical protein
VAQERFGEWKSFGDWKKRWAESNSVINGRSTEWLATDCSMRLRKTFQIILIAIDIVLLQHPSCVRLHVPTLQRAFRLQRQNQQSATYLLLVEDREWKGVERSCRSNRGTVESQSPLPKLDGERREADADGAFAPTYLQVGVQRKKDRHKRCFVGY